MKTRLWELLLKNGVIGGDDERGGEEDMDDRYGWRSDHGESGGSEMEDVVLGFGLWDQGIGSGRPDDIDVEVIRQVSRAYMNTEW